VKAAVETADGVFEVDLDEEELLDFMADERLSRPPRRATRSGPWRSARPPHGPTD